MDTDMKKLIVIALALATSVTVVWADPPPSREEMETAVKSMLKCWETGDAGKFSQAFSEQVLFAYPGDRLDKPALIQMFKDYHQAKKDIKIYFGNFLVEGSRFAMSYQFAATDKATGARQAVGTGASGVFEGGKLVLYKEFYDEHVAPKQAAGQIPLDEGTVTPYPSSMILDPKLIN